jgi:hypothetical protein
MKKRRRMVPGGQESYKFNLGDTEVRTLRKRK